MKLQKASITAPPGLSELLQQLGNGERGFGGTSFGRGEATLDEFLNAVGDGEDAQKVPAGFVPQTVFWMIDDDGQAIGMVRMRHHLNEPLLQSGGHVGYYVAPEKRRRGHAAAALGMALDKLRARGVKRALVTVQPDNVASVRVAIANGGVIDGQGRSAETNGLSNRYWIDLTKD